MTTTRKLKTRIIILFCSVLSFTNCIDDSYDLSSGINTEMNVGGDSLSFPIIRTTKIYLDSMMNSQDIDMLERMDDGTYSFQVKDSMLMTVANIVPVTLSFSSYNNSNFKLNPVNYEKVQSSPTGRISMFLPKKIIPVNISRYVSKDVKRIFSSNLKTNSQITYKFNISNLPASIDSIFFENYTIKFPEYLKFKSGDVNSLNQVILNRGFKVSEGFTKTLTFEKFDFGLTGKTLTDGIFNLSDVVSIEGSIYIKETELTTNQIGIVEIKPYFQIGDISLSVIECEVSPVLAPISKNLVLNLPQYLKEENAKLDLQNPLLNLQIGNTMGISVDAEVILIPKQNGIAIQGASVSCHLEIAAAQKLGETTWSKFCISRQGEGVSDQYQSVVLPELSNLLKVAPDEVDVIVNPTVIGNRQQIDLYSAKNTLEMNYSLSVPLDFGKEFNIVYCDTLISLKQKLENVLKYTRQIDVIAIIENKIPMDLNFEVIPLDLLNRVVSGISIESADSIKSCNTDGSIKISNLNLSIKETTPGSLNYVDGFKFKISATKNNLTAGMPLKVDQYITLEIRVRIPEGIVINPDTNK